MPFDAAVHQHMLIMLIILRAICFCSATFYLGYILSGFVNQAVFVFEYGVAGFDVEPLIGDAAFTALVAFIVLASSEVLPRYRLALAVSLVLISLVLWQIAERTGFFNCFGYFEIFAKPSPYNCNSHNLWRVGSHVGAIALISALMLAVARLIAVIANRYRKLETD